MDFFAFGWKLSQVEDLFLVCHDLWILWTKKDFHFDGSACHARQWHLSRSSWLTRRSRASGTRAPPSHRFGTTSRCKIVGSWTNWLWTTEKGLLKKNRPTSYDYGNIWKLTKYWRMLGYVVFCFSKSSFFSIFSKRTSSDFLPFFFFVVGHEENCGFSKNTKQLDGWLSNFVQFCWNSMGIVMGYHMSQGLNSLYWGWSSNV